MSLLQEIYLLTDIFVQITRTQGLKLYFIFKLNTTTIQDKFQSKTYAHLLYY